jgi:hypothetical protein
MNKATERRPLAAQSASLYWPRPENIQAQFYSNILTVYNSLSLCCLPILLLLLIFSLAIHWQRLYGSAKGQLTTSFA